MPFVSTAVALVLAAAVPAAAPSSASPATATVAPAGAKVRTTTHVVKAKASAPVQTKGERRRHGKDRKRGEKADAHGARTPLPAVPSLSLSLPRAAAKEPSLAGAAKEAEAALDRLVAKAADGAKHVVAAPAEPKGPCLRRPVGVQRGQEFLRFSLTRCDGSAAPRALESLSLLARRDADEDAAGKGTTKAKGKARVAIPELTKLDPRVVERLQVVVDHFDSDEKSPRVELVSASRSVLKGKHSHGRALDFRIEGVSGEDVLAYCHTLADTGCGYYPSGGFVHLEVRERGAGRVAWIDASSSAYTASIPGITPATPAKKPAPAVDEPKDALGAAPKDAPGAAPKEAPVAAPANRDEARPESTHPEEPSDET